MSSLTDLSNKEWFIEEIYLDCNIHNSIPKNNSDIYIEKGYSIDFNNVSQNTVPTEYISGKSFLWLLDM